MKIGVHSGENLARVVYDLLKELSLKHKLLAICADSASNNDTLVTHLHQELLQSFDDRVDQVFGFAAKELMRFRGPEHQIHCLSHALNRMVRDILNSLKAGTMAEASKTID
jgi:hypothetical protein